jgi:putative toxin-antitoxin system antitoxin component (TIGR02293 family)
VSPIPKRSAKQAAAVKSHAITQEGVLDAMVGKQLTELQVTEIVERGLPISSVEVLRREGLTFSEVHGLVLPARTLKHRKEKKQALSIEEADRTLRIARLIALADRVFGNHEKALRWLRCENNRLDGRAPLAMLRSEVGGDLVRQMLYQIDEGIYV